jgi:flagellar M-ring protein FliF
MKPFQQLLARLTLAERVTIVAAALAVAAGVTAFTRWRHEGDFRPLYTALAPDDAGAVLQKLKESGVEFRLADNGATVLAPSERVAELRLAMAASGLPKSGRIGFELFDKTNFGATEFAEHVNYRRALEGELERSIGRSCTWRKWSRRACI